MGKKQKLETVELTNSFLSRIEHFQLLDKQKSLGSTALSSYRRANEVAASRHNTTPKLMWCIQKCLNEKTVKLTEHILTILNCDPMRQVSFRRDSAAPYSPVFTRPVRPRKTWLVTSLEFSWTTNYRTPYTNANEQQQIVLDARNQVF